LIKKGLIVEELNCEQLDEVSGGLGFKKLPDIANGVYEFGTGFWRGAQAGWRVFENYSD